MQTNLEQAIEIIKTLPVEDYDKIRKVLDEVEESKGNKDKTLNQKRMDWIKANREKYARQYVALIENRKGEIELVGTGKTRKEAQGNSAKNGVGNPFITFFYSENDVPFGGW